MAKVKTSCKVSSYDEPGKSDVKVDNHWNRESMVVITIGDEERTVLATDLKRAIDNCTNVGL